MESGAVDLAAGYYFSLITQADKKIISFGKNETGQLGTGEPLWHTSPQKLPNLKIREAATNVNGSYFVDLNGSLWSVGTENWGDLGNRFSSPVKIVWLILETVLFLDHNGSLHGFGNGTNGKLGNNSTSNRNEPIMIHDSIVTAFASGRDHSAMVL